MKQNYAGLLRAIFGVTFLVGLIIIFIPDFRHKGLASRMVCQDNLKQISIALLQYSQDYDDVLPSPKNSNRGLKSSDNWAGKLFPYVLSAPIFQCPKDSGATSGQKFSYGYNARLRLLPLKQVVRKDFTVSFFEVHAVLENWTQTGRGPEAVTASTRHLGGSNFAFADGHVKWLKSGKVGALPPDQGMPTFVPR